MLRILFCAMRWDYGERSRGLSHEYTNLYDSMRRMPGVTAKLFDFMELYRRDGRRAVGEGLLRAVNEFSPDLVFSVLFEDEVPRDVLAELRDRERPFTFNWFCDDHWRFESFTRRYAKLFNGCSTTATSALPKYDALGYANVLKTQWACNPHLYYKAASRQLFDITFVGQPHGDRRDVVAHLRNEGLPVRVWGHGWAEGRLSHDEMVRVFSGSRVNLNLANASTSGGRLIRRLQMVTGKPQLSQQIKGRNFEIPACGGFQLSGAADDLESYYSPDEEIVIYHDLDDLVEKSRRWLADDARRSAVATAGMRRTLAEHTYEHRFNEILRRFGFR